jgi:hypothetical protein
VSVGIDQLADERGGDRRTRGRDHEQPAILAEVDTGDRLDADRRAIEPISTSPPPTRPM